MSNTPATADKLAQQLASDLFAGEIKDAVYEWIANRIFSDPEKYGLPDAAPPQAREDRAGELTEPVLEAVEDYYQSCYGGRL